jgi:hypothetical protein
MCGLVMQCTISHNINQSEMVQLVHPLFGTLFAEAPLVSAEQLGVDFDTLTPLGALSEG